MAREALTVIGTVVGAYFGNPQLGYAIGAMVGGLVDPEQIKAPSIGDVATQTAAEGVPCPLLAGTAGCAGNLIYCSDPRVVKGKFQSGKGGPEVQDPDRVYRTFAIRIGASLFDGPGIRNGITAVRKIWEDEKLVYDVSPESQILAESEAFAPGFTFYPGNETQLPDPDIEAIKGVGNVPSYRGRCYIVFKNKDVTDRRGSVPQYRFEVTVNGATTAPTGGWFIGPVAVDGASGGSQAFYRRADTLEGLLTADNIPTPGGTAMTRISVANGAVFFHGAAGAVSFDGGGTWHAMNSTLSASHNVDWNGNYYYNGLERSADGITWGSIPDLPAGVEYVVAHEFFNNPVIAVDTAGIFHVSLDDGGIWEAKPTPFSYSISVVRPGHLRWMVVLDGSRAYYTDDLFDTFISNNSSQTEQAYFYSNDIDNTWIRKVSSDGFQRSIDNGSTFVEVLDGVEYGSNQDNNVGWGEYIWGLLRVDVVPSPRANYLLVSNDGGEDWVEQLAPVYGSNTSLCYVGEPTPGVVSSGTTTFEQVVLAAGRRCNIPNARWSLPGLSAKTIRGSVVASQNYTAQDYINSLRLVFPSDGACFDGLIHLRLRGGAIERDLDEQFMVDEQDDAEQEETLRNGDEKRLAPLRRPLKINLMFPNAKVGYQLTKATSPNYGDRGDAVSETTLEIPIVLDEETEAPQLADVLDKISRADAEGEIVRIFPENLAADLVTGSLTRLLGDDGLTRRCRVESKRVGDCTVRLLMRVDRAHAVTSQLTSQPGPVWPTPPPSLPGDTVFVVMNLPALRDGHDTLGVYFALSGLPGFAWQGATVDYRVQGSTAWTSLGAFSQRAVMGDLIEPLSAASEFYTDTTNTIAVELLDEDDELDSLTDAEWLSEGNPAAIVYADGTAEIVQFRDADQGSGAEWALTHLQRGRLVTTPGPHLAGATFVMLDGAIFMPLPSSLIGQALEFRVTTAGRSVEESTIHPLTWDPVKSQQEFPPAHLVLERAGDDILASTVPRHRLGTEDNPIASTNWTGYRWTATDGSTTTTADTAPTAPAHTFDVTGWASPVTVTVALTNRFTGPGPTLSEQIA